MNCTLESSRHVEECRIDSAVRALVRALAHGGMALVALAPIALAGGEALGSMRWLEVNGDEHLDLLENRADGSLVLSLGLGNRQFQLVEQVLPPAMIVDLLVADLDGDGNLDLYLVTLERNYALAGDGAGLFVDATAAVGLLDEGAGIRAELRDADADGRADLLLHNQNGDVLFWGVPGGFERDSRTPVASSHSTSSFGSEGLTFPTRDFSESNRAPSDGRFSDGRSDSRGTQPDGRVALPPTSSPMSTASDGDAAQALAASVPIVGPAIPFAPVRGLPKLLIGVTPEQQEILSHLSIEQLPDGDGGTVKTIRLSGANSQLVNGLDATNGSPGNPSSLIGIVNGLGNLIVGYNELGNPAGDKRDCSHNVVIGQGHSYRQFGGLVAARNNYLDKAFATVSGGQNGLANGFFSSISGGKNNTTSSEYASVSGGRYNLATAYGSLVAGGGYNIASGPDAVVSGGYENTASGLGSSISGGRNNIAAGTTSSTTGGQSNLAYGVHASVSGGFSNVASGLRASVSGGYNSVASGGDSTITGGLFNTASSFFSSVSGGKFNTASGMESSVSGGGYCQAIALGSAISGGV